MSKSDFEGVIKELLKGTANIESVNFHFGDCNSTTYMGGEVEEEYEEEYGSEGCCDCCPTDLPVVDNDVLAEWVQKKTGIDPATIGKVLDAETQYLEEIGVAIPVNGDGEEDADTEPEGNGASEPKQKVEPEQESDGKRKDEKLDALFEEMFPGILGMGLMGALFCDILGSAKKKEGKDGKKE